MGRKNKKVFELSSVKKYKRYDRLLWLIPVVVLLDFSFKSWRGVLNAWKEDASLATLIGIVMIDVIYTFFFSIVPFIIGKVIVRMGLKNAIQNCTITSMRDFDYYRDKLTGLSPAAISILADLEIEQKKDIAASILQFENQGLLAEQADHTYITTQKYRDGAALSESDRYLIEHLEKGDLNRETDEKWRELAIADAMKEGYIAPKTFSGKQQGRIKGCVIPFLVVIGWLVWLMSAAPRINEMSAMLDAAPEGMSLAEQVNYLFAYPKFLPVTAEMMALLAVMFFIFLYPIAMAIGTALLGKSIKKIKRTEYGNQMAECVYGMKNFIHDYSNLSEADKRQVVLWEDYLVYAVVLEENEQIVNEIMEMKGETV